MTVNLPFQVPTDDAGKYTFSSMSADDLTSVRSQAREAANQYSEMEVADVSSDDIDTLRELTSIVKGVDAERERRNGAAGAFSALLDTLGDDDDVETDSDKLGGAESATATPAATTTAAAAKPAAPSVAAVASKTAPAVPAETVPLLAPAVILAGANNSDLAAGAEMDWTAVGKRVEKLFLQYSAASGNGSPRRDSVAQFKLEYPQELTASGGTQENGTGIIDYAISESRLPGGSLRASIDIKRKAALARGLGAVESLTAAGTGWCAPSEVLYDLCELESSDGLLDIPEINVSRGGIKYTTGPDFSSIYTGAGYFHYTEAQIISGVTKPTMSVPCPTFVDTRLDADGLAIQADLLQLRGYPELIARFVRGAMIAHTHKINQFMINALVTGSTALALPSNVASHTPGTGTTWYTDHSVVATVLGAIDMAIVDYKYRQRMQLSSTIEIVLPYWVQSWIRSDVTRRSFYDGDHGADQFAITMQNMEDWLRVRNARVQWVYDWQDAFYWAAYPSGAPSAWQQFGQSPTSTDFVQDWPHALQFLLYAAGTWVRGNADIITLDTVYDSTLLAQNKTTQLFTEQGILAAKTCFDSRVYTVGGIGGGLIPDGANSYALNAQATVLTQGLFPTNP